LQKLDPYSGYIDRDEMQGFRTSVESQFGGIGLQITVDNGMLKVSSPLVGTPAYKAGVQSGDRILRIEGESTRELTIDQAVKKLKGDVGTSVTFTVEHALTGKTETYTIKREQIHVDTVLGDHRKTDDSWDFLNCARRSRILKPRSCAG
jgi:carboxyl-terminal processing protease